MTGGAGTNSSRFLHPSSDRKTQTNGYFAKMYLFIREHLAMKDAEGLDDIGSPLPARSHDINQIGVFRENVRHRPHVVVVPGLLKRNDSGSNVLFIGGLRRRCFRASHE